MPLYYVTTLYFRRVTVLKVNTMMMNIKHIVNNQVYGQHKISKNNQEGTEISVALIISAETGIV